MKTDFFPQGFLGQPLVCWFASEVPKMETLEVGFPNSFTLRNGEILLGGILGPHIGHHHPGHPRALWTWL